MIVVRARRVLCFAAGLLALAAGVKTAQSHSSHLNQRSGLRSRQLLVALHRRGRVPALPRGTEVTPLGSQSGELLITVPPTADASSVESALRHDAGVAAIQRNDVWRAAQSRVECAPRPTVPVTQQAAAVDASATTPPATTGPIAILDTGVDASAPELTGRIRPGANVVSGGTNTSDSDGHGTAVAGVAAAQPGEVLGVSPTSPIIPIKILDSQGASSAAWVVAGINAALARGASVINISATGPASTRPTRDDQVVERAIDTAVSRGVVVVAPSGNEGSATVDVPASYPHVLAVAATGTNGLPATFSNRGPAVDLAAPGQALTEPAPKSVCPAGYQLVTGTSFSAPAVAGAAVLLAAARPGLTATQRIEMLRRGPAARGTSAWDAATGFGTLDVAASLSASTPAATPVEINDDVYWVTGARRPGKASLARGATATGRIDSTKNRLDVLPLLVKKGARITASLAVMGGQASVGFWDPHTRAFDISQGRRKHRLAATGVGAQVTLRSRSVPKTGTYFLSVQTARTPPGGSAYRLAVSG